MSLAQDNVTVYQITSPTTCNLHAYRQASKLRFEKLFHLDYFTSVRTANSPRLLYLAASWLVARWFLGGELVGGETPYWRDDGKVQNMDPWSMDPLCGPGPWTGFIKIWTGSMDPLIMDRVHGPPIFTILYRYSLNSLEC